MTDSSKVLTGAERAFLWALACWGGGTGPRFWDAFSPPRGERLRRAWTAVHPAGAAAARAALFADHAAGVRPDPRRVHPSWALRGLTGESPAVQRAAVSQAPGEWRRLLLDGLGLTAGDLQADHPPHPEALSWARALWTERLVGGRPDPDSDPPVIRALSRLGPRALTLLVHAIALAKWALAGEEPPRSGARQRDRLAHFRCLFDAPDARLRELSRRDIAAVRGARRHTRARLGLITVGRSLSVAEPYRVRWALQHIPYPIARFARTLMPAPSGRAHVWVGWENAILLASWDRLAAEGRLPAPSEGVE